MEITFQLGRLVILIVTLFESKKWSILTNTKPIKTHRNRNHLTRRGLKNICPNATQNVFWVLLSGHLMNLNIGWLSESSLSKSEIKKYYLVFWVKFLKVIYPFFFNKGIVNSKALSTLSSFLHSFFPWKILSLNYVSITSLEIAYKCLDFVTKRKWQWAILNPLVWLFS